MRIKSTDTSFASEPIIVTVKEPIISSPSPSLTPSRKPSSGGSSRKNTPTPTPTLAPTPTETPESTVKPETVQTPEPTENSNADTWFDDVPDNLWYYEPIKYAVNHNLMYGMSETKFMPEIDITRAMFVTILHRIEGEPETMFEYMFEDVPTDSFYSNAIAWANENKIVEGYSSEEFVPEQTITREQMAAIIYRYAKFKGYNIEVNTTLNYIDSESISDYAREAVIWASDKGFMYGNTDNTFEPQAYATRAQAAAVFQRVVEN